MILIYNIHFLIINQLSKGPYCRIIRINFIHCLTKLRNIIFISAPQLQETTQQQQRGDCGLLQCGRSGIIP